VALEKSREWEGQPMGNPMQIKARLGSGQTVAEMLSLFFWVTPRKHYIITPILEYIQTIGYLGKA